MKIRILRDGLYSHFVGDKSEAQHRSAGDVLEYPDWYAESLVDSEQAVEEIPATFTVSSTTPTEYVAEEAPSHKPARKARAPRRKSTR